MLPWNYLQYNEIIRRILANNRLWTSKGRLATYIPELSKGNLDYLGIVVLSDSGQITHGDTKVKFTLQSISKILTLMIALRDQGFDKVFSYVGSEPTGDPFNSIVKLETLEEKPLNPMINAGAIAVSSLIDGSSVEDKLDRVLELVSEITGKNATYNRQIYLSEKETGHRNRALAYFMKDTNVLRGDVEEVLDLYFRQCSIEVNCEDLAKIGFFLANKGKLPSGKRLIPSDIVRIVTTFMVTCGMYNASGKFAIDVGLPAKSGVSGGIVGCVPGKMGVATFGPALDNKGNSIAGVHMLADLSHELGLSIF